MAKFKVFTVLDKLAEEYGPPFVAPNDGVAVRSFRQMMAQAPNVSKGDYALYCVGEWDNADGLVKADVEPRSVIEGSLIGGEGVIPFPGGKKHE